MTIQQNIHNTLSNINTIAQACGRDPKHIRLVAVSKRFPADAIQQAQEAGQNIFGENYIQEAQEKHKFLGDSTSFHFIGHLQSNKAKIAAEIFSMIETVDRVKLAQALNRHLANLHRELDILVQVNVGMEDQKSGVEPAQAEQLMREISELPRLKVRGLMTMPPFTADPEEARPYFRKLRLLAENLAEKELFYDNNAVELSMGMTSDYHVAIEEGATLIRIGTAIFGERPPRQPR